MHSPVAQAIGIAADIEAERSSIPGCAGVGGVEDIAIGSGIFPDVGINVVGILRVDGEAEDAEFLILRPISRASRVVADEIEQLGPGGSVVDSLKKSANVGACIDNIDIMGIVEDAIDEPASWDVDVLPGISGQQPTVLEPFDRETVSRMKRTTSLAARRLSKPDVVPARHVSSPKSINANDACHKRTDV